MQDVLQPRRTANLAQGGRAEIIEGLQRLVGKPAPRPEVAVTGKETILEVLARAADDSKFLTRLAIDPSEALAEYDLNSEERAALASGDLARIESWVGKLDKRLSTWIWCRLQQEKW